MAIGDCNARSPRRGLMEPTTLLPRSFSNNLTPTLHLADGSQDDNVLPFISQMLMEDDAVDEFLYQQHPDHNPALLQTQQIFAQALSNTSGSSTSTLADVHAGAEGNDDLQDQPSFNGTATGAVEPANTLSPVEGSNCFMDAVSMAFFKGMEEANKFLPGPGAGGCTTGCRGRKKRLNGDDEAEGRSSKQMAADGEESEESAVREMLDQLMLNGDDEPLLRLDDDMQELRAAMDMAKTPPGKPASTSADPNEQQAVDLHSMLIRCADAVANNDGRNAADILERIRRHSSPSGNATQRLAHYFAEGLEVRLNGTGSLHYRSSMMMAKIANTSGVNLKRQQFFMASCCFLPVNNLFSNKTIYNAAAGRKKLHIVQYGLDHGLQWATLLRWLARREGGPPEVRFTGINFPKPGFRPARLIEEAGHRLIACARQLGVPFKFHGIAAKSEAVRVGDLDIDPDDVLVVCSLLHFRTLTDEGTMATDDGTGTTDPISAVLSAIREMKPSVFVHAVLNVSYSTAFFATRFREALYNFTAQFDMMDTILPRDNGRRLDFERDVLSRCAVNIIACEGADRVLHPRSYKQWQARSRRAGLRQLPLDPDIVQTVRDKVRKEYHENFVISEDQKWLLEAWKGRVLYAISTWTAGNDLATGA